jgi:hypothetical protein
MSTWDLVEQLKASYGDGESFDASVVFELANRALEAETPNSTARPEGKYTTDTF